MKKGIITCLLAAMALCAPLTILEKVEAYENVTAQEAYNMVAAGEAVMLDVRSLEELHWVGSPSLVPGGDPICYAIPWEFYTINADGSVLTLKNLDFDDLVSQTFPNLDRPIITICRSGGRSSSAADRLEALGYANVYEVDNALKNGRGGFQGVKL